ncbi:Serine palmitoyltransferase 2 [Desmophyllum pertusum]|uniref:Serine palmitoyltransferase 2 n=1 Tax=Desmophyllum pertusum TaxID=174260 RepID=A0A9W9YB55_9CNID|nr:Serine palmitoyltransferase 2 [Desmophyllum pertusum]
MNRTGKSNAKKGPDVDYNAFRDFTDRETEAHIITRWMVFVGMTDMEGDLTTRPIPDTTDWDLQMKREWLYKETQVFLNEVFLQTTVPENVIMLDDAHKQGFSCRTPDCEMQFPLHSTRVRHEQQRHGLITDDGGDDNRDSYGYYKCRGPCSLVFATNVTRKRHESVQHPDVEIATNPEDQHSEEPTSESDLIFNYHNARLQIGMLLVDIVDAIKEGDGYRLVNCYKFVLLFAYKFRNTKYAYALLLFFVLNLCSAFKGRVLLFNRK